jgi:hypothetical protein
MRRRREKQVRKFYWLWGAVDDWPAWAKKILDGR